MPSLASFVERACRCLPQQGRCCHARYFTGTYGHVLSQLQIRRKPLQRSANGGSWPNPTESGMKPDFAAHTTKKGAHSAAHMCPSINRRSLRVPIGHRWLKSYTSWPHLGHREATCAMLTTKTRPDLCQGVKGGRRALHEVS